MADPQERLEQLIRVLKGTGHRLTPQRLAMLKVIAKSEGHPSVERIYEQIKADFPTTSLATVYKTLSLLKEMGEVLELSFPPLGSRYDGNRPYSGPRWLRRAQWSRNRWRCQASTVAGCTKTRTSRQRDQPRDSHDQKSRSGRRTRGRRMDRS